MDNNLKARIFKDRCVNEYMKFKRELSVMFRRPAQAGQTVLQNVALKTKSRTLALQDQRPG